MSERVKVWDPFVRIFHWTLVVSFLLAYVTEDDYLDVHVIAGYVALGLVLARIVWGFVGSQYARFSDFIYPPAVVVEHINQFRSKHPRRYLGHNPAGGAMVVALITMNVLIGVTGIALYGADQHAGPMAAMMAASGESVEEALEEIHEVLSNLTLGLVVLHVLGVMMVSRQHGENLVHSMLHGYKRKD